MTYTAKLNNVVIKSSPSLITLIRKTEKSPDAKYFGPGLPETGVSRFKATEHWYNNRQGKYAHLACK